MRIDAHLHFWKPSCGFDNRPVADNAAYRRDFMPADVAPDLDAAGIDGAIVVQTAPQTAETDWLIDVTANEGRIYGLTGWVDLAGGECDYGALLACPKVVGIRAQLRRIADDAFVAKPDVISNLDAALRSGLSVTILAEARHYQHLRDVLPRLADGPVIINHLGLPFRTSIATRGARRCAHSPRSRRRSSSYRACRSCTGRAGATATHVRCWTTLSRSSVRNG
jgi:L-fuconolactonase